MSTLTSFVGLAPGVLLRLRPGLQARIQERATLVAPNGQAYFLDDDLAAILVQCNGRTSESAFPDFKKILSRYPALANLLRTSVEPFDAGHQIVRTPEMPAACRVAIWHVTRRCNMHCQHCYYLYDSDRRSEFTLSSIRAIAANLRSLGVELVRVSGGEPTISRSFPEILHELAANALHFIVNTNGKHLKPAHLELLVANPYLRSMQVSLDGPRAAHDLLRGGTSYDAVLETIRTLVAAGVYVRVVSMLHPAWMAPSPVVDFADFVATLGVQDWVVEVPSATGLSVEDARRHAVPIFDCAAALRSWCVTGANTLRYVELTQVFEWPTQQYDEKSLDAPVCSHDLGLLTFGAEGISYCTLFREQFGQDWKDFASADGDFQDVLGAWRRIAGLRAVKTIRQNPTCARCELFSDCQGGCPGQYQSPGEFAGCDLHSRTLAIARRRLRDVELG